MDIWNTPLIWAPANYPQAWRCFCPRDLAFPQGRNTPSGSAFTAPCAWTVGFVPQPVSATTRLGKPSKLWATLFYWGRAESYLTAGGNSSLWKYHLLYWVFIVDAFTDFYLGKRKLFVNSGSRLQLQLCAWKWKLGQDYRSYNTNRNMWDLGEVYIMMYPIKNFKIWFVLFSPGRSVGPYM